MRNRRSSPPGPAGTSGGEPRSSAPDLVRRYVEGCVADGVMPGAAWRVMSGGRIVSGGAAGVTERGPGGEPVSEGTPFDLASLTKPLATALLLVMLERDGVVALDSPAPSFLPELAGTAHESRSLIAFATHTAGLPAWSPLFLHASTLEGYLQRMARMPPIPEPTATLYSDLGYIVLGAVLQRATGRALDELFLERVARPLGLRRIGFARPPTPFADAAATERGNAHEQALAGDEGNGFPWRRAIPRGEVHDANAHGLGGVAGHAGLFGTVGAVARICEALGDSDPLGLGERARERLLRPQPGSPGRTVGMVTAAHSSCAKGVLPDAAPGHTGFTGTSLWLDPARAGIFVLLTNRVHPEVGDRDFQPVRLGFHREAVRLVAARNPDTR